MDKNPNALYRPYREKHRSALNGAIVYSTSQVIVRVSKKLCWLPAAIDWSYTLLFDGKRALLRQLSVFVNGWTLEAADAVAEDKFSKRRIIESLNDPEPLEKNGKLL